MLKVGITGGIGSGKSTVTRLFSMLGAPVLYADDIAKELMRSDAGIRKKIIDAFGNESYVLGELNRTYLATTVFSSPEKLQELNGIIHPAVIDYGKNWMQMQKAPYAIKEAALFFESGSYKDMDIMIGVSAPSLLRIQRVLQRDATTEDEVKKRMARQMPESDKLAKCQYVIVNDGNEAILPQVIQLHYKFTTGNTHNTD